MEAQSWVPQRRDFVGYTDGEMAGEGNDFLQQIMQTRPQKEDVVRNLLQSVKQPVDKRKDPKGPN